MTNTHDVINLQSLRGRVFQGFVEFVDPSTSSPTLAFHRLQERQTATITLNYNLDEHYRDDGIKGVDPAGYSHNINITLKLTSDMFASAGATAPFTGGNLSYLINQIDAQGTGTGAPLNPVQVTFVGTINFIPGASPPFDTEHYVHFVVNAVINQFGPITWNPNGGVHEMTISGPIITLTVPQRSTHKYSDGTDTP